MKEGAFTVDIMENGFVLNTHCGKSFICQSVYDVAALMAGVLNIPNVHTTGLSFNNLHTFAGEESE